ncbi:MAG: D-Ala-D-Ala carboxypeptidase family metallohydrolase [Pseudomonadota bacterium]|nr:D-Ala-D-Ala carboxypeptidase family metallohydrolase [Pseudomonadota bacterium]
MNKLTALMRITFLCMLFTTSSAFAFDNTKLKSPMVINGNTIPYPLFSIFVMPEQQFSVGFADEAVSGEYQFDGKKGTLPQSTITAPNSSGHFLLIINNNQTGEEATVNVFVMIPLKKVDNNGKLNGYTIGKYPSKPLKNNPIYLPPKGFVEVLPSQTSLKLTPNFSLGQFVSKQQQDFPKYVHLRAGLLLKLENILHTLNAESYPVEGLTIMSGYRTPFYNKAIGNVQYSRHVWGGAADFYIDQSPKDGIMDDLNKDGKIDRNDAVWLANFVANMSSRGAFGPRIGGLGIYSANSAHGPFIHVDVRGSLARW